MKKTIMILILALTFALTACGQNAGPASVPTTTLDTGASDSGLPAPVSANGIIASAEVRPATTVNLSFPLLGGVKTVAVQVGESVTPGQIIATLDTTILEAQVAEAEANVVTAETQVHYLVRVGTSQEQLDSANADVDRAKAVVEQAQATLSQAMLASPIGGIVTAVNTAPGETATPGQVVIVVADLTHMRIETTDLSERDIPAVQIGQTASVFIDALNEAFTGKVVDIDRQSETVGGDVTYKVTLELDEQPAGLRWGMSAEVNIQTEQ